MAGVAVRVESGEIGERKVLCSIVKELLFSKMLTNKGWNRNVLVEIDAQRMIRRLEADVTGGFGAALAAPACVRDVFVGGRQVVSGGRHVNEPAIVARYRDAARALLQ